MKTQGYLFVFSFVLVCFLPESGISQCVLPGSVTSVTSPADSGPGSLREAINWANSQAGPDGITFSGVSKIYITSGSLTLMDSSGTVIIGGGVYVDGVSSSTFFNAFEIASDNNCIENLNVQNFSGSGIAVQNSSNNQFYNVSSSSNLFSGVEILGSNASNNSFDSVTLSNNSENGAMVASGAHDNTFTNCTVNSNANEGIYIFDQSYNNVVDGCSLTNNGENGVFISESSYNNVIKNSNLTSNYSGVYINFGSYNNTIGPNNTISNSQYVGVAISDAGTYSNVVTDNASINSNAFYGVFLNLGAYDNTIYNNDINNNGFDGIRIVNSGQNDFLNNQINYNGSSGIYASGDASDNLRFIGNQVSSNSGYGIYISEADNIDISAGGESCSVQSNSRDGIFLNGASNGISSVTVDSCTIKFNSGNGIDASNVSGLSINSSTISNNANGLIVLNSSSISSTSSSYTSNGSTGFYIYNSTNVSLSGDNVSFNYYYGLSFLYGSSSLTLNNVTVNSNPHSNLYCNSSNNIQISQGSFDNSWRPYPDDPPSVCYNTGSGICLSGCGNINISNVSSIDANEIGIKAQNSTNINVSNSNIISSSLYSIQLENATTVTLSGNTLNSADMGLYVYNSSDLTVGTNNSFSNQVTGIYMYGVPETPLSSIDGNTFSNCGDYCIFIVPDYGSDRSPAGAGDDKTTRPEVKNNTFNADPSFASIYAIDTQPLNIDNILNGSSGNTFNSSSPAYIQAWMGIVYAISYEGDPVSGASVQLTYQNGERVSFNTGSNGVGAPGRGSVDEKDVLTWGRIKGLILYPNGTTLNLQPATISASGSSLSQSGAYSWDGNTDNDSPMRYALPSTTPGFEGVNTNGRYQAAILPMETSCSSDFLRSGGESAYNIVTPGSVYAVVFDSDENKNNSAFERVTGTVKSLDYNGSVIDSIEVEMVETTPSNGYFKSNKMINVSPECPLRENSICEIDVPGDPDCCIKATGEGTQTLRLEHIDPYDTYPPVDSCNDQISIKTNPQIYFLEKVNGGYKEVTSYNAPATIITLVFDLDKSDGQANDYKRIGYWVVSNGKRTQMESSVPVSESFGSFVDGITRDGYFFKFLDGVTDQTLADDLNSQKMYSAVYIKPGDTFCVTTQEVGESQVSKCVEFSTPTTCSAEFTDFQQNTVTEFPTSSTVYLRVIDGDKNKNKDEIDEVQVTVVNDDSADVENVTLTETGVDTGIFTGSIFLKKYLAEEQVISGNGIISANGNQSLRINYTDPNDPQDICNASLQTIDFTTKSQTSIVDSSLNPLELVKSTDGFYVLVEDGNRNTRAGYPDEITCLLYSNMRGLNSYDDFEVIKLTETSPSSGTFTSSLIPVKYGTAQQGNGTLEVYTGGISVTAFYIDSLDPTDRSYDTAVVMDAVLKIDLQLSRNYFYSSSPVPFRIKVENPNPVPVTNFIIEVDTTNNLNIYKNYVSINGRGQTISRGSPYSIPITSIPPSDTIYIYGQIYPSIEVRNKTVKITTVARSGSAREIVISNKDTDSCEIGSHPIEDKSRIVGSIFIDEDGDGLKDSEEPGIPGVTVCIEKGNCSITDKQGRYHINDIEIGYSGGGDNTDFYNYERINVKIDESTLPPGLIAFEENRIIEMQKGMMKTVNFPVFPELGPVKKNFESLLKYRATFSGRITSHTIKGSVTRGIVDINGESISLPGVDVDLAVKVDERYFVLKRGRLDENLVFTVSSTEKMPDAFTFYIKDPSGKEVFKYESQNRVPQFIEWNGKDRRGRMILKPDKEYYFYALEKKDEMVSRSSDKNFVILSRKPLKTLEKGIYFETGQYYLLPLFIKKLRELAQYLRENKDISIIIEGHTDSTGPEWYNLELSKKRAEMVKEYLVVVEGINESRITTRGLGESRPLYPNDTSENMARNRRVEIKTEEGRMLLQLSSFQPSASVNGKEIPVENSGEFEISLPPENNEFSIELKDNTGKSSFFTKSSGNISADLPPYEEFIPGEPKMISITLFGEKGSYAVFKGQKFTANDSGEIIVPLVLKKPEAQYKLKIYFREHLPVNYVVSYTSKPLTRIGYRRSGIILYLPEEKVINFSRNRIPVAGKAPTSCTITVNGKKINVDKNGLFSTLASFGEDVTSGILDIKGWIGTEKVEIKKTVLIDRNYHYTNALAYGSFGIELSKDFSSPGFWGLGKIASYGFGRFPFGLSYEFGVDTGLEKYNNIWKRMITLDPQKTNRISQALNVAKEEYPEYGDDSISYDHTASMGNTYLKIKYRKDTGMILGAFDTGFTESELGYYSRALYGVRYDMASSTFLKRKYNLGVKGFVAKEKTAFERDEFISTGGSIYHLRKKPVVEGSERIYVEIRDQVLRDLVVNSEKYRLKRGVDYDIDYDTGRIHLFYPLTTFITSRRAGELLSGDIIVMVVEYEYNNQGIDNITFGDRLSFSLLNNVRTGINYVESGKFNLISADVKIDFNKYITGIFEFGMSHKSPGDVMLSYDGGITFQSTFPSELTEVAEDWAKAWKVELQSDNSYLKGNAYYIRKEKGFSNGREESRGSEQYGIRVKSSYLKNYSLKVLFDQWRIGGLNEASIIQKIDTGAEAKFSFIKTSLDFSWSRRFSENSDGYGRESYLSPFISYTIRKNNNFYLIPYLKGQVKLGTKGKIYEGGNQVSGGITTNLFSPVVATIEGAYGESGVGSRIGLSYNSDKKTTSYMDYTVLNRNEEGLLNQLSFGTSYSVSKRMKFYGEQRLSYAKLQTQNSNIVGINWYLVKGLNAGIYYERSKVKRIYDVAESMDDLIHTRQSGGIVLGYKNSRMKSFGKFEVTNSKNGSNLVGFAGELYSRFKVKDNISIFGRYRREIEKDYSSPDRALKKDSYEEITLGIGLRDIFKRLNSLFKASYIRELLPDGNGNIAPADGVNTDIIQKTLALYSDNSFLVDDRLSLVLKQGWRNEYCHFANLECSLYKYLAGIGANYRFLKKWEAELDFLFEKQNGGEHYEGLLVEVMRTIIEHLNLGIGYNFSGIDLGEYNVGSSTGTNTFFVRVEGYY